MHSIMSQKTRDGLIEKQSQRCQISRSLRTDEGHAGASMYIALMEQVRQHCDLVLDGTKPIDDLAREACEQIQSLSQ
jgi:hypothetical protein